MVVAITVGAYFCNAVFAFAVSGPRPPRIRPAAAKTRQHWRLIIGWGVAVGLGHAVATIFVARLGVGWFTLALGLVLLVMMTVVRVGAGPDHRRRAGQAPLKDKLSAGAASGALSAVLTSPGFVFNRLGLLLAGTKVLQIPGIILFSIGVALQAAATSGAKAVKLGTRFAGGSERRRRHQPRGNQRMGEGGLSPSEVSKEIAEHKHHHGDEEATGRDRVVTIVEASLLAVVAVLAAWSGYASSKWSTESSLTLARASAARSEANRADLESLGSAQLRRGHVQHLVHGLHRRQPGRPGRGHPPVPTRRSRWPSTPGSPPNP